MRPEAVKEAQRAELVEPNRRPLVRVEEQTSKLRCRQHSMACDETHDRPIPIGQMTSERPAKLVVRPTGGRLTG